MTVSVFIQTLNEEDNLPRCLEALSFSDDIVVLDSFSSDRTKEIALAAGARFFQRTYDGRAANQNWAVENIVFKHPWVYYSDADEIVTPALRDEILAVVSDKSREDVVYRLRFKNMFMGSWNKRSSMYPTWVPRLFRPEFIRWNRGANPVPIISGKEGLLREHFLHYSFNKGMAAWFDKHNKYSNYEAYETLKELDNGTLRFGDFFSDSAAVRRQALKKLSFRLPARPLAKFFYMYFLRGGFLDGRAGFHYCFLQSVYDYMISIKVKELLIRRSGGSV